MVAEAAETTINTDRLMWAVLTMKYITTCSQHAIRTVNVLGRKRVDNAVYDRNYDFGNTDFNQFPFLL